ncbi:MAG: triose-phosphate isomerase [Verrucomicrobia bacterium]|nr:triose-phosphate isomerase [Verrucomicrobiota bacterium]MBU6446282.1 triose-phosphate isomerase [Verrucomicrobiota bacterium]MDE3047593.1 triose-phosphate isomerase [Verrucomicrobiota bacterium]
MTAESFTVIGNWKMYKTSRQATDYIEALLPLIENTKVNVYLAVPYTSIHSAAQVAKETPLQIGAQNMNDAREGAFTGEIAGLMLKEAGASFVLLGHSERRHVFKEGDELIHKKVIRALQDDIQPVLCIGETLAHHGKGKTQEVIQEQLSTALQGIPKEEASKVVIAYEPVWAIGSGQTPTVEQIQKTHAFIRAVLGELFGERVGKKIPILYGGSVKPENVFEIASAKDVNGVLVGGASLDPQTFASIIQNIVGGASKKRVTRKKKEKTT